MTKRAEKAIEILNDNWCMIDSILTKNELKYFSNNDFVAYLVKAVRAYSDKCESENKRIT